LINPKAYAMRKLLFDVLALRRSRTGNVCVSCSFSHVAV